MSLIEQAGMARKPVLRVIRYQDFARYPDPAAPQPLPGAPPEARRCLVYRQANGLGHLLFPPFDADVVYQGGMSFDVHTEDELGERLWRGVMREIVGVPSGWWCSKIPGILQIDPGLIYVTPPGTKLLLTAPLNRRTEPFLVQSGVLDSDWFWVPSAVNLEVFEIGARFELRRDSPIAQLVPLSVDLLDRGADELAIDASPEALRMWRGYMEDKFNSVPVDSWGDQLPPVQHGSYAKWKREFEGCPHHHDTKVRP